VRAEVARSADGDEIVPVRWDDNYLSLRPNETRTITAQYGTLGAGALTVRAEGWNVPRVSLELP
jgi:exo-1,4-beta-D-glucosaminidase